MPLRGSSISDVDRMSMAYTSSHSDEVADEVGLVVIADWGKFGNVSVHLLFTPLNRPKKPTL